MAALVPKIIKVFADIGATGPTGANGLTATYQLVQFGSLKSGTPLATNVQATIQALSEYEYGIKSALINGAPLAIQEIDALNYLLTSSAAYIQWYGIGRYNAAIEYFLGSFCKDDTSTGKVLFISRINNNINNSVLTSTNWMPFASKEMNSTATLNHNIPAYDMYREHTANTATGIVLPESSALNKGRSILILNTGNQTKTITAANSDTINGAASFSLVTKAYVKVISTGTEWQLIGQGGYL